MTAKNPASLRRAVACGALLSLLFLVLPAAAQSLIPLPEMSQRATVAQRIALTDVSVTYHRPLVGGRKIWGALVPYGQPWRAGANENTVIEFSDPVLVEGRPLARGVYGLHMIPSENAWTIVFSTNSSSWGSFSYDKSEDALRVDVTPHPADMQEALAYEFNDPKSDSAVLTLRWEKLAVPIRISVAPEATMAHLRDELRSGAQYSWISWDEAATYLLQQKRDLDQALTWAKRSVQMEERFDNLVTQSDILKELHRNDEAATAFHRAMEIGSVAQLYSYGRQLQFQKRQPEAMEMFKVVAQRYPSNRYGHLAQARLLSASGKYADAAKEVTAARDVSDSDQLKKILDPLIARLQANQDINN
jgi:tetratricopeptide (TPR) repeat protein